MCASSCHSPERRLTLYWRWGVCVCVCKGVCVVCVDLIDLVLFCFVVYNVRNLIIYTLIHTLYTLTITPWYLILYQLTPSYFTPSKSTPSPSQSTPLHPLWPSPSLPQVLQTAWCPHSRHHQHRRLINLPGESLRRAHQCRAGDWRGINQGIHLPDDLTGHVRSDDVRRPYIITTEEIRDYPRTACFAGSDQGGACVSVCVCLDSMYFHPSQTESRPITTIVCNVNSGYIDWLFVLLCLFLILCSVSGAESGLQDSGDQQECVWEEVFTCTWTRLQLCYLSWRSSG